MVVNETVNVSKDVFSDAINSVVPLILDKIQPLMGILKAVSIALLVWLVFMIVRSIMRIKNFRRMARMEDKLDRILTLLEKNKTTEGITSLGRKKKK